MKISELKNNLSEGLLDFFKRKDPENLPLPEFLQAIVKTTEGFDFIKYDGNTLNLVSTKSESDNRQALEELKILKKAVQFEKQNIRFAAQSARQQYQQKVANRDPMVWTTGTGTFGRVMRGMTRGSRAIDRSNQASINQNFNVLIRTCDAILQGIAKIELVIKKELLTGNFNNVPAPKQQKISRLPDVSKLTPEQKQELLRQLDALEVGNK